MAISPEATVTTEEELAELLCSVRRHLHRFPETGFEEHRTSAYLRDIFHRYGIETVGPMAETGFVVEIVGEHDGPMVGYRAELDALPAPDAKKVSYASSETTAAHLCGHDAHMAIALGVALLLNERRDRLHGIVRVLFQPNEESIPTGAPRMIKAGAIDGLREIFCVHSDPSLDTGRIGLRAGPVTAATASWMVHIYSGQAGHSARPHETVDTIWLAHQILAAYYQLPGRVHDARQPAVLTACMFHAGHALNVIPNEVEVGGTLRSPDIETVRFLSGKMEEVAQNQAALYDTEVRYEADLSLPGVVNDPLLVEVVRRTAEDLLGPQAVINLPKPSMGGEDFAFYGEHIPSVLVRIGTRGGPETGYPLHHSLFDVDEEALAPAANLMAEVLTRRLARITKAE